MDENEIQYTKNLELYMKEVGEQSLCLSMLHKSSEGVFSNKSLAIDLPVIILSTITGSLTLSSKSLFGEENEENALKIVGTLSLFAGILGTIQAYFSFSRRSENDKNSYLSYGKLYREIKVQLGLPRDKGRMRARDLLRQIDQEYQRLDELSPLIPIAVVNIFKKKYKGSTIDRPPSINGLNEIKIYCKEDTDTPTIPSLVGENVILNVNDVVV